MKIKPFAGCCNARILLDLGTAHEWKDGVVTYKSLKDFKEVIHKKFVSNYNGYWGVAEINVVAITGPEQTNERNWLNKLGFSEMKMGNSLRIHSIYVPDWFKMYGIKTEPK